VDAVAVDGAYRVVLDQHVVEPGRCRVAEDLEEDARAGVVVLLGLVAVDVVHVQATDPVVRSRSGIGAGDVDAAPGRRGVPLVGDVEVGDLPVLLVRESDHVRHLAGARQLRFDAAAVGVDPDRTPRRSRALGEELLPGAGGAALEEDRLTRLERTGVDRRQGVPGLGLAAVAAGGGTAVHVEGLGLRRCVAGGREPHRGEGEGQDGQEQGESS
jgi:hypothetical protein